MDKEEKLNFVMSKIVEFGRYSFGQQEKREESLLNQSSQMLTACSVTAAIFSNIILNSINIFKVAALISLLVSLVFAVMAGWRFKICWMANIDSFYEDVYNNNEKYEDPYQFDYQWKHQLSMLHKDKERINAIRTRYILFSMCAFACFVVIAAFSIFYF